MQLEGAVEPKYHFHIWLPSTVCQVIYSPMRQPCKAKGSVSALLPAVLLYLHTCIFYYFFANDTCAANPFLVFFCVRHAHFIERVGCPPFFYCDPTLPFAPMISSPTSRPLLVPLLTQ